jgi:hypothetical protein
MEQQNKGIIPAKSRFLIVFNRYFTFDLLFTVLVVFHDPTTTRMGKHFSVPNTIFQCLCHVRHRFSLPHQPFGPGAKTLPLRAQSMVLTSLPTFYRLEGVNTVNANESICGSGAVSKSVSEGSRQLWKIPAV